MDKAIVLQIQGQKFGYLAPRLIVGRCKAASKPRVEKEEIGGSWRKPASSI